VVKCPNCKRENPDGVDVCVYCGHLIDPTGIRKQPKTRQLQDSDNDENQPRWGSARFDRNTRLFLRLVEAGQLIDVDMFNYPQGVVIGRRDPETNERPEVDLAPYDANEQGVSRRHARLHVQEDALRITDLGSANFTFLNGLKLTPHQSRILRDGDELRLGRFKIQVTFASVHSDDR